MINMKYFSMFSGIGGFDLAARWIGWETKWYSEIDPYAIRVMERWFPEAYNVGDVTTFLSDSESDIRRTPRDERSKSFDGRSHTIDILCGGFPCQPVSCAGKQLAQADPRWLWPHFARIIRVLRPRYVVAENVPGLLGRGATDVLRDFAALGYDVEWETIPASAVGAPHRRDRVWFLAYPSGDGRIREREPEHAGEQSASGIEPDGLRERRRREGTDIPDARRALLQERGTWDRNGRRAATEQPRSGGAWWATESTIRGMASRLPEGLHGGWEREWDGVPRVATGVKHRVDRLKCLGNSIVPQIAYWLFQQIAALEAGKGDDGS